MHSEKTSEDIAKEYSGAAEVFAKAAEKSNQESAKSAEIILQFTKSIAAFDSEFIANGKSTPPLETKGKHINDYLTDYDYYSGKASDINRSLALAGVAIVWLFRNPESSKVLFSDNLLLPLLFLVISLILDLLQYFLGSIFWLLFYEYKYHFWKRRKTISDDQAKDIPAPNWLSMPLTLLFFAKIISMGLAYYYLFSFLQNKIQIL